MAGCPNGTGGSETKSYSYTLTFDADGGTPAAQTKTVKSPATAVDNLPDTPKKTGFVFMGWFTEKNGAGTKFDKTTTVTKDMTVYAKWLTGYTVSFDADGGAPARQTKTVISPATTVDGLPTEPTKNGWAFKGWYTEKDGAGTQFIATTPVSADTTVYAYWDYIELAYSALDAYLASASDTATHYIYVTGLSAADLKGTYSPPTPSPLGEKLKAQPTKKVALKLPASIAGLTDMTACFMNCETLVGISPIPASVTNMYGCFMNCRSLVSAPVIPASVTNMYGCFLRCESLTTAPDIPSTVTGSMTYCFEDCSLLVTAPTIPNGVTDIGRCFMNCTSLKTVPPLPASVTDMYACFLGCTSLETVPQVPASVTNIGVCFKSCTKLTGAVLNCNYGTSANFENAFTDCSALANGSIKVPSGQLAAYQGAAANMGTTSDKFSALP